MSKRRSSLTKTQIRTRAGAELLSLCQSITEDGILSKKEIIALRSWLRANRSEDLPAIEFLTETIERIAADGRITPAERKDLQTAIETVLPPDYRREAVAQRKAVEAARREREKARRTAEREQKRAERALNKPLRSANFMVAGVGYEGRGEIIQRYVAPEDQVFLVRDCHNRFSSNAIEVRVTNGHQIGYVPEEYARDLAPLFDQGAAHVAYVTKILTTRHGPVPVVQAYVYRPEAQVAGLVRPHEVPAARSSGLRSAHNNRSTSRSRLVVLALLVALGFVLLLIAL